MLGICKLCHLEKELCDSHIIPEFFYKPLYDKDHKAKKIALDSFINVGGPDVKKGIREKLLCSVCEEIFSKLEVYASNKWRRELLTISQSTNSNQLKGINYTKFKLFLISIIWRCSITSNQDFNIRLSSSHQERMRIMLLKNAPGCYDKYGCTISAIFYNKELQDDCIFVDAESVLIDGHICYHLIFGGFLWTFYTSSHKPSQNTAKRFLQPSNDLIVGKENLPEMKYLMKYAEMKYPFIS